MQFLVSRLASPTIVDFDEDGRTDTLSPGDSHVTPQQPPLHSGVLHPNGLQQQRVCAEKSLIRPRLNSTEQSLLCPERFVPSSMLSVMQPQVSAQKLALTTPASVERQQDFVRQQGNSDEKACYDSVAVVDQQHDCIVPQTAYVDYLCHSSLGRRCAEKSNIAAVHQQEYSTSPCVSADRICQGTVGPQSDFALKSSCVAALSDTESAMSLNELLDGCQYDTDAGETYAVDSSGVDDCSPPAVSLDCETINVLHVSVNSNAKHGDSIPHISDSSMPGLALNPRPSERMCNSVELSGQSECTTSAICSEVMQSDCPITSPLMQRGFVESNLSSSSSSDKAHADDGYHSNVTSAMSHDSTVYSDKISMLAAVQPVST